MSIDVLEQELASGRAGHFALITPCWAKETAPTRDFSERIARAKAFKTDSIIEARAIDDSSIEVVEVSDKSRGEIGLGRFPIAEFVVALDPSNARIVLIEEFDALSSDAQLDWLCRFRAQRETGGALRVVFAGRWRARSLLREWRTQRSNARFSTSPALEEHHIYVVPGYQRADVTPWIESILSKASERIIGALVECVLVRTRGDSELLSELMQLRRCSPRELERALFGLSERDRIQELVMRRVRRVSESGRKMLAACIRYGVLRADLRDQGALEELWLEGLVRSRSHAIDHLWLIASPTVDAVLRSHAASWTPDETVLAASELAPIEHPPLAAAAELVLEIEGSLRNLIMQGYCERAAREDGHPLQIAPRRTSTSSQASNSIVYNDACQRRDRDAGGPLERFVSHPLSVQLEVSDLSTFLADTKLRQPLVDNIFSDQRGLQTKLVAFSELRNAVAHNKLCSIGAVEELERLAAELLGRLGTAAFRATMPDPGELVRIGKHTIKLDGPKPFATVVIENLIDVDLHGVLISVRVEHSGSKSLSSRSGSVSLKPRGTFLVRIELEVDEVPEGDVNPVFTVESASAAKT